MKKLATFLFVFGFQNVYSQCSDDFYCLSFEDTICRYHLTVDTINFPKNIWQTGNAQKSVFDSTVCATNVIVTDTANPYPINNHSVFTITKIATTGDVYGFRILGGDYYVETQKRCWGRFISTQ